MTSMVVLKFIRICDETGYRLYRNTITGEVIAIE